MPHRLPCSCSAEVVVTAGQAGGSVECPRCGRVLSVPKLRDQGGLRPCHAGVTAPAVALAINHLAINHLAINEVWSEGLSRAGVRRPPAEGEQVVLRRAQSADGMRGVLRGVVALLVPLSARKPSPGRDAHSNPGQKLR